MKIENVKNLKDYKWPSKSGETWRHVTNYCLRNLEGEIVDFFIDQGEYVLSGNLLPCPSFLNLPTLPIEAKVVNYSIDFGSTLKDSNKGLWLKSDNNKHDIWYKLESPSPNCIQYANSMKRKVKELLKISDCIKYLYPDFSIHNTITDTKIIKSKTIYDLYTISNQYINLNYIREESYFILYQLGTIIDMEHSKRFYNSIRYFDEDEANRVMKLFNPSLPLKKLKKQQLLSNIPQNIFNQSLAINPLKLLQNAESISSYMDDTKNTNTTCMNNNINTNSNINENDKNRMVISYSSYPIHNDIDSLSNRYIDKPIKKKMKTIEHKTIIPPLDLKQMIIDNSSKTMTSSSLSSLSNHKAILINSIADRNEDIIHYEQLSVVEKERYDELQKNTIYNSYALRYNDVSMSIENILPKVNAQSVPVDSLNSMKQPPALSHITNDHSITIKNELIIPPPPPISPSSSLSPKISTYIQGKILENHQMKELTNTTIRTSNPTSVSKKITWNTQVHIALFNDTTSDLTYIEDTLPYY